MRIYNERANINKNAHIKKEVQQDLFIHAAEVAEALGISRPYAYKLVRELNKELEEKGFLTISGKVSRRYFEERIYGMQTSNKEELDASV